MKRLVVFILLGWAIGFSPAVFSAGKKQDLADKVDYASVNREIQRFEAVLDNVLNSAFSSSKGLAVYQSAKGFYLQEYGAYFHFLVNIHVAEVSTPFGNIRSRENPGAEAKKRRIEELKEKLISALLENGEILQQLRKEQCVSIIAHIKDRNFPDEPSAEKTIIISVSKKDLNEFSNKSDRLAQFKQRIKIIEY
jgi:hypothetical protein